jgi:AraC-like DNA-binding protein
MPHTELLPSKDLFGARVRYSDVNTTAPADLPYHYHDHYEVFCSLNDSLGYQVNDLMYNLEHGDVLVLNQFDVHRSLAAPGSSYHRQVVIFFPELVASLSVPGYDLLRCFERRPPRFRHRLRLQDADRRSFQRLIARGIDAGRRRNAESSIVERLITAELLVLVNRGTPLEAERPAGASTTPRDDALLREVLSFIDGHIAEELSLQRLARMFATTPNGLNRLCRRHGRQTLHQYILQRRIEHARLDLSRGSTVTETALASGFGNLSHFIRIFKQRTGLSPKEFQRRILAQSGR